MPKQCSHEGCNTQPNYGKKGGWELVDIDQFRDYHNKYAFLRVINKHSNLSGK